MEIFVIIVIIAALMIFFMSRHNARVRETWEEAATELHLKFKKPASGMLSIQGSRAGVNVVIETAYHNKTRWTMFKVGFNEDLPVSFELKKQHFLSGISKRLLNSQDIEIGDFAFDEKAIITGRDPDAVRAFFTRERRDILKRVFDRFDSYEISAGSIRAEHHSLISSKQELVRAAKLLLGTARAMMDTQKEPAPVPPPLPKRTPPPFAEPVEQAPEVGELSEEPPVVPEEPPPVPSPFEMAGETDLEDAPIEVEEGADVPVVVYSPAITHEVTDFACDILDLFSLNSSHYAISTSFAKLFLNEKISSTIIPQRIEKYFLDRTFGRGPGIILRGEICRLEDDKKITLVIAYPEDENLSDLREAVGKSHAFSGTLIKCDTFAGEIFLVADRSET